jgi:hypothetical protein
LTCAQDNEFLPGVRHLQSGGDDDRDDQQGGGWHEVTHGTKHRADDEAGDRKKYGDRIHFWLLAQEVALRTLILIRIRMFCRAILLSPKTSISPPNSPELHERPRLKPESKAAILRLGYTGNGSTRVAERALNFWECEQF